MLRIACVLCSNNVYSTIEHCISCQGLQLCVMVHFERSVAVFACAAQSSKAREVQVFTAKFIENLRSLLQSAAFRLLLAPKQPAYPYASCPGRLTVVQTGISRIESFYVLKICCFGPVTRLNTISTAPSASHCHIRRSAFWCRILQPCVPTSHGNMHVHLCRRLRSSMVV